MATMNNLRMEEAILGLQNRFQDHKKEWVQETIQTTLQLHSDSLQTENSLENVKNLLQESLQETLQTQTKQKMISQIFETIEEKEWFSREQTNLLQEKLRPWVLDFPIQIEISVPEKKFLVHPRKSTGCVVLLGFLGLFLGSFLHQSALFSLLGSSFGFSFLLFLQTQKNAGLALHTSIHRLASFFELPEERDLFFWKQCMQKQVENSVRDLFHVSLSFLRLLGLLEDVKTAQKLENVSSIQDLFLTCQDGFAEIYYADVKRDEGRAMDACIKLLSDLQKVGLKVISLPQETLFSPDLLDSFEVRGRMELEDPVQVVYPAWKYHEQILTRGLLKKRKSSLPS